MPHTAVFAPPTAIGLIGVGGFGAYHLKYLREIEAEGLGRLVAVADRTTAGLGDVRGALEARGVRWFDDYLRMIDETQLDLVIVATPIFLHVPMTLEILRRTNAAIYLEKPPAPTLPLLRELIAADPQHRVHVGFQMSVWKVFRQLKAWIAGGRFGRISRITAGAVWPRTDAYYGRSAWAGRMTTDTGSPVFDGPATNALAHLVHGVMFLASSEQEGFARPIAVKGEFYRARPIESYDAACLSGKFASGITYAIATAHNSREERDFGIHVTGDRGEGRIEGNGTRLYASFQEEPLTVGDPYDATMHRETLLRLRAGHLPVNSLTDCLGYSLATFGALDAAGGVRDIPASLVEAGEPGADRIFHVAGMAEAVKETLATGATWSEQDRPWTPHLSRAPGSPNGVSTRSASHQIPGEPSALTVG